MTLMMTMEEEVVVGNACRARGVDCKDADADNKPAMSAEAGADCTAADDALVGESQWEIAVDVVADSIGDVVVVADIDYVLVDADEFSLPFSFSLPQKLLIPLH